MRAARMHGYKQPLVLEGVAVPDIVQEYGAVALACGRQNTLLTRHVSASRVASREPAPTPAVSNAGRGAPARDDRRIEVMQSSDSASRSFWRPTAFGTSFRT